jgi:hypothetical protein
VSRRLPYRGYVLHADPFRRRAGWVSRVVIELHERGGVNFQEVAGDPFVTFRTREEAEEASLGFGRTLLDSRPTTAGRGAEGSTP